MSTTLTDLTYDDCIVLFSNNYDGANKDYRSNLFISEIKNIAQSKKSSRNSNSFVPNDLSIDIEDMEPHKSILFQKRYGLGDNDVHVEWAFWLASVMIARSTKTDANFSRRLKGKILELLKRLTSPLSGSFEDLVAMYIQEKLMADIRDGNNTPILSTRNEWGKATSFTFKDFTVDPLITDRTSDAYNAANAPQFRITTLNERAISLQRFHDLQLAPLATPLNANIVNNQLSLTNYVQNIDFSGGLVYGLTTQFTDNPLNARGVQISQFYNWTAIPDSTAPGNNLLEASSDQRFKNNNAVVSNDTFVADLRLRLQAGGGVLTEGEINAYHKLLKGLQDKIKKEITGVTEFGYEQDAFFVKLLLRTAVKNAVSPLSKWFSEPAATGETKAQERYFRKLVDGKIYEKLSDGTVKCVDLNDPEIQKTLKANSKCYSLGVGQKSTNQNTCATYLKDCINNGNIANCKKYLKDHNFWQNAAQEVHDMLPDLAYKTLQSFQFETYDEFSKTANRSLKMVQSWQEWLESCKNSGKLNSNDLVQISNNVKLQEYLNKIIMKVNENPAILNKDYTEKPTDIANAFRGTLLAKKGLIYESVPKSSVRSNLERLGLAINDSQNRTVVNFSSNSFPGLRVILSGGAPPVQTLNSEIIEAQFMNLKNRLKQHNKDISPNDEKGILDLLVVLKEKEAKLNEFIIMTDKYADLLQVFGQTDKETVLTVDHLRQFTEARNNYFNKVSKKQNNLMSILKAIAEKVNEIDNKSTPVTKKTVPIQ